MREMSLVPLKQKRYSEPWCKGAEQEGHIYNVKLSKWRLSRLPRKDRLKREHTDRVAKWGMQVREVPGFDAEKFDTFLSDMDIQFKPRLPNGFRKGLPFFYIPTLKVLFWHGKRIPLLTRAVVVKVQYSGGKLYFCTISRKTYNLYKCYPEILARIENETERKLILVKERWVMDYSDNKLYRLYGRGRASIIKHLRRGK